jgi:hypothetical protein
MMTSDHQSPGEKVAGVRIPAEALTVSLADGRTVSAPLAWFPRLRDATPAQRANWKICGAGYGIIWPELAEDLSTAGLLRGTPAPGGRAVRG